MHGFNLQEVAHLPGTFDKLWIRGTFPTSFLARSEEESYRWRLNFTESFLERDIPQLGIRIPASALRRFWTMTAHFHGQVWNASDFASALGTKHDTARRYLDILCGSYMVRQVQPWFVNIGKRVVRSPKIYLRDSGIAHALLGLRNKLQVQMHPRLGFSWEGFVVEQIIALTGADNETFFYRTHAGAELDLLVNRHGKAWGFECKYEDAPRTNKSMHSVIVDLSLEKLFIVTPGERSYPLTEKIDVVSLPDLVRTLERHALMNT